MYSVVLAAMLTAGPATAPAWSHMSCHGCCGGYNAFSSSCCGGYTACCGGYTSCCGGYTSCCGGYVASYSCCGGYTACCGGHQSYWGGYASCCCGGQNASWSGYSSCCGGYSSCCGGWYPAYSSCCGGYTPCCGGVMAVPSTGAPDMPKATEVHKEKKDGAAAATTATVIVKAPLDVHITVNGQRTERTTAEQTFTTPDLEPGKAYSYDFRAEAVRDGKTVTAVKKVIVQAGLEVQADFTDLSRSDSSAHVTIKAPTDSRVTVDGVEVPASVRSFNTPALEAGREYYYTVKMETTRDGRKVAESQRVVVEAGKDVLVKFDEPAVTTAGK